jgi:protein involved in sex pheromone biosynthesis
MVYLFTVNTYVPHYTKLTERKKHMDNEFKKLNIDNPIYVTDFDGDSLT